MKKTVFLTSGSLPDRAGSHALTVRLAERLCRAAGVSAPRLLYLDNGKPVFDKPGQFLSASHTAGKIFVAVSSLPVGIDAEAVREAPEKVSSRWFSPAERERDFYKVWTGKEAVAKISGAGLSALRRIEVGEKKAFFDGETFFLRQLETDGVAITVAASAPFEVEWIE